MQAMLELIFNSSKKGQGGKQAKQELKELTGTLGEISSGLTGVNLAGMTAAGALLAIGNFAKDSTEKFIAYGATIRDLSAITGTGAEDTSRLVQTMDDFGVTTEKVGTIAEQAAKKGFLLTVDALADLADEYNSLDTQEEKNALMTEKLGRAGLELNKVMEDGGDAIREKAAAQADGLILTEEEARQAEKMRQNVDELNDTWEAFTLQVGGGVAGALNSVIDKQRAYQDLIASGITIKELNNMTTAQKDAALAALELADSQEWVATHSRDAKELLGGYNEKVGEMPAALDPAIIAQDKLNDLMKGYNDALLFTIASEGLSADAALRLAKQMGLVQSETLIANEKTAEWKKELDEGKIKVEEYELRILNLQKAIAALEDRTVTVTVQTQWEGGSGNSGLDANVLPSGFTDYDQYNGGAGVTPVPEFVPPDGMSANGADFIVPPGYANDSYLMGVSSGEHVRVVNDRMRWTGEGGGDILFHIGQVTIATEADYQKLFRRLSQDLTHVMRR